MSGQLTGCAESFEQHGLGDVRVEIPHVEGSVGVSLGVVHLDSSSGVDSTKRSSSQMAIFLAFGVLLLFLIWIFSFLLFFGFLNF